MAIGSMAHSACYYDRVPRTACNTSQTLACIHFTLLVQLIKGENMQAGSKSTCSDT